MAMITELAVLLCLAAFLHFVFNFLRNRARVLQTFALAGIPGPSPSFFTGNFPEYINGPHEALGRWVNNFGSVFGYFQGGIPFLVLSDLADVHEVLVKLGTSFNNRQAAIIKFEPFNSSLIQQRGKRWKKTRRILAPAFTAHKIALQTTKTVINESVARLISHIEASGSTEHFNLSLGSKCLSLDIITRLAFNMNPVDIYDEKCTLRELAIEFLEHSSNFPVALTAYFPSSEKLFRLLFGIFGGGNLVNMILTHLEKVVKEYEIPSESLAKVNLLDFMLEQKAHGTLNETELMGNAILILLAGYETSAISWTFTLYLLAKHPQIQRQLREELLSIIKESGLENEETDGCFFDDHRSEMLDRIWIESLRLYPPVVTFVTRELDDDLTPQLTLSSGITVNRGTVIQIPVRSIHHNANHWSDPLTFDPFRENLSDNLSGTGATANSAFFAFGAGQRNCIGRFLAQSEARAVISSLVLKYQLVLVEDDVELHTGMRQVVCHSTIMHPRKDVFLKLLPIDKM